MGEPVSRVASTSDGSAQQVIQALLRRAPSLDPETSFLGFVASQVKQPVPKSRIPHDFWLGSVDATRTTDCHFFPSAVPSSRAEVFYVASVVDQMLAAGRHERDRLESVTSAVLCGLLECCRHARCASFELGVFMERLVSALDASFRTHAEVVMTLKGEVAVARGYDPANEIHEIHELLHSKEVQLHAAQRRIAEMEAEADVLREQAAAAATWKKARDDIAAVLVRQSARNKVIMDLEISRLEVEKSKLAIVAEAESSGELGDILSFSDHAVQVNLDVKFDSDIGKSIVNLVTNLQHQMDAVVDLCAPFYSKGGFQSVSRPASVALGKLNDLAVRIGETDAKATTTVEATGSHAGRVPSHVSKQLVTDVLAACDQAVRQMEARISALAQRTDIRKLAFPLCAPTSSSESCQLCGRIEVDPELLNVATELEKAHTTIKQQQKAAELLHAERLALQDELEVASVRLSRQRDRVTVASCQTDGAYDSSPPLVLQLVIEPRSSTPLNRRKSGTPRRSSTSRKPTDRESPIQLEKSRTGPRGIAAAGAGGQSSRRYNSRASVAGAQRRATEFDSVDPSRPVLSPTPQPSGAMDPATTSARDTRATMNASDVAPLDRSARRPSVVSRDHVPWEAIVCRASGLHAANSSDTSRITSANQPMPSHQTEIPTTFGTASLKPLSWVLKCADSILSTPIRGGFRKMIWTHFSSMSGSTSVALDNAASFLRSITEHQERDGRAQMLHELTTFEFETVADCVVQATSTLNSRLATLAGGGRDVDRRPQELALSVALDTVANCAPSASLAAFLPLMTSVIAAAYVTTDPCATAMHVQSVDRVVQRWPQMPQLPDDALYRKIQRWQLLRAIAHVAIDPNGSRTSLDRLFTAGVPTAQDAWRADAADSDDDGSDPGSEM